MNATRKAFIAKIAPDAIRATQGTGLFPSLMIAQACLEGRDGQSSLAAKHHNHFGIKKGTAWFGKVVIMKTKEYLKGLWQTVDAPFRSYASLYDGFKDRCNFLERNKRYKENGVFSADTPEKQAAALQKAGYATDPLYAKSLVSLINMYSLKQYDAKKKTEPA